MKTPSTNQIMDSVENVVAISAGASVGNGVATLLPAQNNAIIKIGASALAIFGASALGKDRGSKAIKNMAYGFAGTHIVGLVQEQIQKVVTAKASPTAIDKFVEGVAGLRGNESYGYQTLPRLMASSSFMGSDDFQPMAESQDNKAASLI